MNAVKKTKKLMISVLSQRKAATSTSSNGCVPGAIFVELKCLQLQHFEQMAPPVVKKKKGKDNRYVYITERTRYLQHDIPPVDTVVEEDKLQKKLVLARETADWKLEAKSLMQLGQLMKWRGREEQGDAYQIQASSILRTHTFAEEEEEQSD